MYCFCTEKNQFHTIAKPSILLNYSYFCTLLHNLLWQSKVKENVPSATGWKMM